MIMIAKQKDCVRTCWSDVLSKKSELKRLNIKKMSMFDNIDAFWMNNYLYKKKDKMYDMQMSKLAWGFIVNLYERGILSEINYRLY